VKKEEVMRGRLTGLLATGVLVALVALALSSCGGGASGAGSSGGGEHHQQAKARTLPEEAEKALPPGEYHSEEFKPSFSFRIGKGWQTPDAELKEESDRLSIEVVKEVKGYGSLLTFRSVHEAYDSRKHKWVDVNTPEQILSWFQHNPYLKTEKPQPVTVGGVKGVQIAYTVAKDSPVDSVKSFRYSDGLTGDIDSGVMSHGIILDVKGEAITIAPGLPKAQKVVDTVKWEGV
jgi:hypothetical protein